jgi:hypothetical protein
MPFEMAWCSGFLNMMWGTSGELLVAGRARSRPVTFDVRFDSIYAFTQHSCRIYMFGVARGVDATRW